MQKELIVAPASYDACKYACKNFHYSKSVPGGKLVKHGVWEGGKFKGVVLYGDTASASMHTPYGLDYTQVCELRRVALINHEHTVTEIISKSLKLLKKNNPNLELVVSYADQEQEHLGIIYQAGNWIYEGETKPTSAFLINGKKVHGRTVNNVYGCSKMEYLRKNVDKNVRKVKNKPKFKYLMPLTKRARRKFEYLHKDYPKVIK